MPRPSSKPKLFSLSPESKSLVQTYIDTQTADDHLYYNPDGKKTDLIALSKELSDAVYCINTGSPSSDHVRSIASRIIERCDSTDETPVHNQTKEQICRDIVGKLTPLLKSELAGKNLCIKTRNDVAFIKVTEVDVGMSNSRVPSVYVRGTGFIADDDPKYKFMETPVSPRFTTSYGVSISDMLLEGKDSYSHKYLYVLSNVMMQDLLGVFISALLEKLGMNSEDSPKLVCQILSK